MAHSDPSSRHPFPLPRQPGDLSTPSQLPPSPHASWCLEEIADPSSQWLEGDILGSCPRAGKAAVETGPSITCCTSLGRRTHRRGRTLTRCPRVGRRARAGILRTPQADSGPALAAGWSAEHPVLSAYLCLPAICWLLLRPFHWVLPRSSTCFSRLTGTVVRMLTAPAVPSVRGLS